jgi:cyclophilin family peptidyl-prolyl cis-trans isomerase
VVFGKVTSGMDVVMAMEACGSKDGTPTKRVVIAACGDLQVRFLDDANISLGDAKSSLGDA